MNLLVKLLRLEGGFQSPKTLIFSYYALPCHLPTIVYAPHAAHHLTETC